VVRKNGGVNREEERGEGEDNSDDEDGSNVGYVSGTPPPLLEDAALVTAVSENRMAVVIQEWKMEEDISVVFRLFSVLVEPPTNLDLGAIEGLSRYLMILCEWLKKLPENGVRGVANRCWWIIAGVSVRSVPMQIVSYVLTGLCHRTGKRIRRTQWKGLLTRLEKYQKRLINWCPSINFPVQDGLGYPQDRPTRRSMLNMFFNPNPALRLQLVPIEGV
jgi:hypothetical protein